MGYIAGFEDAKNGELTTWRNGIQVLQGYNLLLELVVIIETLILSRLMTRRDAVKFHLDRFINYFSP